MVRVELSAEVTMVGEEGRLRLETSTSSSSAIDD